MPAINLIVILVIFVIVYFLIPETGNKKKTIEMILMQGEVKQVLSGTEFVLRNKTGTQNIKLYGIKTQRPYEDGGLVAKKHLEDFILSRRVACLVIKNDPDNNALVLRSISFFTVNYYMIVSGYAWYCRETCMIKEICDAWRALTIDAKKDGKGLWGYPWMGKFIPVFEEVK